MERERAARVEAELVREIEAEDRKIEQERERLAGLPPESASERENRALRERLERLECERDRRTYEVPPQRWGETTQERDQRDRRETLRLMRNARAAQAAQAALMAHRRKVAGQANALERQIDAVTAEGAQLDQQHAAAKEEVAARRGALQDELATLLALPAEPEKVTV
ncbi:MAG: hypothetical protein ACLP1Q_21440 [Solirubrobacteraceae bacterium]